jgi:flagellar hook-length control protein FliK
MPSVPVLPTVAVPPAAVQARGPAANDQGAVVNAARAAADGRDSPQDASDGMVSFELVLEAQLGLQTVSKAPGSVQGADAAPTSADAHAPCKPAEKPPTAVDAAAAMLMLPANVVIPQVPPPVDASPLAVGTTAGAHDGRQGGGTALAVEPGKANIKTERPDSAVISASGESPETTPSTPANFATALQTLPASDAAAPTHSAPAESKDNTASAISPVLAAPAGAVADRKIEVAQPQARTDTLPHVVGDEHWGEGLSQRVVWMVGQDVHAAKFQVEPPQLGPVEVKVTISNDQATVSFAAAHSATREAIQTALPRLQEMLLESGVSLGNVFVGSHSPQNQHGAAAGGGSSRQGPGENAGVIAADSIGADRSLQVRRSVGLVDLYA